MAKKVTQSNDNYSNINKLTYDISTMYETPKIEEMYSAPDIDEIGVNFLIADRELFTDISQMYQPVPFGWTFTEDNFNVDYEIMQIKKPITKPGDIWQMGRHRLMCGDPTDTGAVAELMDGKKARMVFTDPMWNVVYGSETRLGHNQRKLFDDKMSSEDLYKTLLVVLKVMVSVCESGTPTYIVMSVSKVATFMKAAKETGYNWSSTIIWYKDSPTLCNKDYHESYEPIWYGWQNSKKCLCPVRNRNQSDVWQFDRFETGELHPNMKPIALSRRALENSSRQNDIVLDLFGGSGTTLMAAEQTERVANMMELDPRYADTIVQRFIKFTETDAGVYLLRNGERFAYNDVPRSQ